MKNLLENWNKFIKEESDQQNSLLQLLQNHLGQMGAQPSEQLLSDIQEFSSVSDEQKDEAAEYVLGSYNEVIGNKSSPKMIPGEYIYSDVDSLYKPTLVYVVEDAEFKITSLSDLKRSQGNPESDQQTNDSEEQGVFENYNRYSKIRKEKTNILKESWKKHFQKKKLL